MRTCLMLGVREEDDEGRSRDRPDRVAGVLRLVFAKLTDVSGQEMVDWFGGQKRTRFSVLTLTTSHGWEHYGNLVTYMRLKGLVPPSSERAPSTGQ
jgi:uncharacterized damage-inducible protein DinB